MVAIDKSKPAIASGTYIPALDGLRAVAALLVVAFHARIVSGGFIGVDVFFVLSAFLITGILQREISQTGAIRLSRFYLRRLARLGPALAFLLAGYIAFAPLIWPSHPHLFDAMLAGLYVSNYSFALFKEPLYLQHTWSLAVEDQFYLLWRLLLPVLMRARIPILWLGAAYVAVICWRASFGDDWASYYYRADTRASGLIIGAALALYLHRLTFTPVYAWTGIGAIIVAAAFGEFGPTSATVFPVAEIGAALVVGAAAHGQLGRLKIALCAPIAIRLGKLSYGIYLWHYPITVALRPWLDGVTLFGAVLVPSVALAWLSFVTIERLPMMIGTRVDLKARRAVIPTGQRP
ncbi:acyltransferase family protein [Erythrobacter sanguineus]|uniref:acyltransferase family protein n=1 Tax=Erythrobacter sanguineus TaxID=198312 RepID=UPI0015BC13FB|nr:acyltransferase [Erythrobacter sanguineus]